MSLEPGDRVAGYTIERLIGRGGMGAVYLARHARLQRAAALKVMIPELAEDDSYIERFVRESQLAASLEHPNVVPIYDADEHDGLLFIAMRYVEGSDLRRLLQQDGALTPEHTLRIVEAVAGALDAAHAAELVHRDVKPANILIEQPGERVFLTDFGVAKRSGLTTMTVAGARVGTADYCAPEQISGHDVDGRADVYSLTCVAFHCLAGQPPYPRDSELAVAHAHVHDLVPALSTVRPGLPRELDGVIAVGMAKNPEVRYATAGELARSARAANEDRTAPTLLAAAPTVAPGDDTVPGPTGEAPTPPARQPPRRTRRWKPAYWLAAAGVAGLIAAGVLAVVLTNNDANSPPPPPPPPAPPPPPPPPIPAHFARVVTRQQALTSAVVAADGDAKSFARMKNAADEVAAEITRFEGFLDGVAVPKGEQAARASLRRALTAHLAYAHSFRDFPSEPGSFTDAEARATTSLAEQAEAAYRQSASLNSTLPVIALSRADHEHLIDLVSDEPPPPPPPPATVRFTSVDRLQRCSATAAFVRCSSGPSGENVQLRPGGRPAYLGRLGSTDTGGPALAYGESRLAPGGRIRCSSSSRGITCTDLRTGAFFTLGDRSHALSSESGGFPSPYTGSFTSSDRLQHCIASDREVVCGSGPSGQVVVLDAGSGARYAGAPGSSDQGGPAMAQGTSFRTPGGTIECSSSSRGITCRDLAGSGESFTIGDRYVDVNGVRYAG